MTSQDDTIVNSHLGGLMVMENSSSLPLSRVDVLLDAAYRRIFIIIYAVIWIFFFWVYVNILLSNLIRFWLTVDEGQRKYLLRIFRLII